MPDQFVVFQYNPESLHLQIGRQEGPEGAPASAGRRTPQELITCSLVFDATDELERPEENPSASEHGVSPSLAALELLMYDRKRRKPRWWEFWRFGASSESGPLALFIWGARRVVPVRLVQLDIAEIQHDPTLLPIRATVNLRMQVVTEEDLPRGHPAVGHWRQHLAALETLASEGYSATPPVEMKSP